MKWEYKVEAIALEGSGVRLGGREETLNQLGEDEWEAVGMWHPVKGIDGNTLCDTWVLFKRPLK